MAWVYMSIQLHIFCFIMYFVFYYGFKTYKIKARIFWKSKDSGNARTHTHTRLTALFRDYPGEPVPEK